MRADEPGRYYPLSMDNRLEAVLSGDGKWKLHLPHRYRHVVEEGGDGLPGKTNNPQIELSLFDLENDLMESINVIEKYPEVAHRLQKLAKQHQERFYAKENR